MTPLVQNFTNLFCFATLILDIFAVALFFILITPLRKRGWTKRVAEFFGERAILLSFLVAFLAMAGSLFYSEIANFAPCLLCWWQRIFLYPQAFILFVAMLKKDLNAKIYAIVLSAIGGIISVYHMLLQLGVGVNDLLPCDASGVSCQHVYFIQYGYITIPTMSLTAFALILLFLCSPNPKKKEVNEI